MIALGGLRTLRKRQVQINLVLICYFSLNAAVPCDLLRLEISELEKLLLRLLILEEQLLVLVLQFLDHFILGSLDLETLLAS